MGSLASKGSAGGEETSGPAPGRASETASHNPACSAVVFVFSPASGLPQEAVDAVRSLGWSHLHNDAGIEGLASKIRSAPKAPAPQSGSRVVVTSPAISAVELEEFEDLCGPLTFAIILGPAPDTAKGAQREFFSEMALVVEVLEAEGKLLRHTMPDARGALAEDLATVMGCYDKSCETGSSVQSMVLKAKALLVRSAFKRFAPNDKKVPLGEAVGFLKLMGLPHGRRAINELKSFDKNEDEAIDLEEFNEYLDKGIHHKLEAQWAMALADLYSEGDPLGPEPRQAPPGFLARAFQRDACCTSRPRSMAGSIVPNTRPLPHALMGIIEKNSNGLAEVRGDSEEQSNMCHAILSKISNTLLNPGSPESRTCEEYLLDITTRGPAGIWHWREVEFAKEEPFAECARGSVPADAKAALERGGAALAEASMKFGPEFNKTMELFVENLTSWKEEVVVDAEAIRNLDDPAIIAFSFGTGEKIGRAADMPTLVGPGCETPGLMNCGLAAQVQRILAVRPMPVYSQWEIADALLYGKAGCPESTYDSFFEWDFDDGLPDSEPADGVACNGYSRIDKYTTPGGAQVAVYKALPIWPKVVKEGLAEFEALADPSTIQKFYLSTAGVLEQFHNIWKFHIDTKPKTVIIVGHPDHRKRCRMNVEFLAVPQGDGSKKTLAIDNLVMPAEEFYGDWAKFGCDSCGYDPTSTQPWTTKRPFYIAHEAACRNMAWMRGDFGPLPFQSVAPQKAEPAAGAKGNKRVSAILDKSGLLSLLAPCDNFALPAKAEGQAKQRCRDATRRLVAARRLVREAPCCA